MSIRMMNPVARPQAEAPREAVPVEELHGRRLGLLFNGHVSSVRFWSELERILSERYHPQSVASLRKENTFAPAAAGGEIERLRAEAEVAIVGVGA
jgi:hypothetical protein